MSNHDQVGILSDAEHKFYNSRRFPLRLGSSKIPKSLLVGMALFCLAVLFIIIALSVKENNKSLHEHPKRHPSNSIENNKSPHQHPKRHPKDSINKNPTSRNVLPKNETIAIQQQLLNLKGVFDQDTLLVSKVQKSPVQSAMFKLPIEENQTFGTQEAVVDNFDGRIVDIEADYETRCIYFVSSKTSSQIKKACEDTHFLVEDVLDETQKQNQNIEDIALDWVGRNLFWTNVQQKTIEAISLDGKHHSFFKPLYLNNSTVVLDKPRAMAIDSLQGLLFWSDWGATPHIGRAGVTGDNATIIFHKSISWPNSISLDVQSQRLYTVDAMHYTLLSMNYDGSQIKVLQDKRNPYLRHVFKLDLFIGSTGPTQMFWTDWHYHDLVTYNLKDNSSNPILSADYSYRFFGILVVSKNRHPSVPSGCQYKSACPNGLCFHTPGFANLAPNYAFSQPNNYTCSDEIVVDDNEQVREDSRCRPNEFECKDLTQCILKSWVCDQQTDCPDESDEAKEICGERVPNCDPDEEFMCHSNKDCIDLSWKCDGERDCTDNSDEHECETKE